MGTGKILNRRWWVLACTAILGCGPDLEEIRTDRQFIGACNHCERCEDGGGWMCVPEGESCDDLCPRSNIAGWRETDHSVCRCIGTNDLYLFRESESRAFHCDLNELTLEVCMKARIEGTSAVTNSR